MTAFPQIRSVLICFVCQQLWLPMMLSPKRFASALLRFVPRFVPICFLLYVFVRAQFYIPEWRIFQNSFSLFAGGW
jgi:hypothetical protein